MLEVQESAQLIEEERGFALFGSLPFTSTRFGRFLCSIFTDDILLGATCVGGEYSDCLLRFGTPDF